MLIWPWRGGKDEQTHFERGEAARFPGWLGSVASDQKRLKPGCGGWSWHFEGAVLTTQTTTRKKKPYKPTETINYVSQSFLLFLKKEKSRLFRSNQEYFLFFFAMIEAFCILMDKCPLEKKVYILNFHYETNLYPIKAFGPGLWLMRCQTPLALCSLVG